MPIAYCLLPIFTHYLLPITYCLLPSHYLPKQAQVHAMGPGPGPLGPPWLGAVPHRGAGGGATPGGPPNASAAECIRRPNAFSGRMHSEAVCIRRQYAIKAECNQGRMQSISLLPIAYCLLPIDIQNIMNLCSKNVVFAQKLT